VKQKRKQKVSHVEFIREQMKKKGWNAAALSRASGVSTGVLSRYFNDDGISADNLFAIMDSLNLFEYEDKNDFTCGWDEETIAACKEIKEIYDSKNKLVISALKTNLAAFTDSIKKDNAIKKLSQDVNRLKMLVDPNTSPDIGKAASGIGKKKMVA